MTLRALARVASTGSARRWHAACCAGVASAPELLSSRKQSWAWTSAYVHDMQSVIGNFGLPMLLKLMQAASAWSESRARLRRVPQCL
jgi:hypothetical protein